VINLHIGSSPTRPTAAADAQHVVAAILMFQNTIASMTDYLISGDLRALPEHVGGLGRGQVGWMPYLLERIDTHLEAEAT
jgi:hypothetical protein